MKVSKRSARHRQSKSGWMRCDSLCYLLVFFSNLLLARKEPTASISGISSPERLHRYHKHGPSLLHPANILKMVLLSCFVPHMACSSRTFHGETLVGHSMAQNFLVILHWLEVTDINDPSRGGWQRRLLWTVDSFWRAA